jgi:LysR family glycine cleavage system transcriptional activator
MLEGLPPLSHLRAFEAAARLGSFTLAADELGVTQSAVSHHMRSLELLTGAALFQRIARGVRVTPEGERLALAVREGLGRVAQAIAQLRKAGDTRRVVVGTVPGFAVKWLFPRLARFDEAWPGIDVDVLASAQLVDLAAAEADVAIRYGAGTFPGLEAEPLLGEITVPVCSPRLLDGRNPPRRPADLAGHVLLHDVLMDSGGRATGWRRWLAAAGVPDLAAAHNRRYSQSNMVLDAAADGLGIALGRSSLVAGDLASGRLVVPMGPALETGLGYHIVWSGDLAARSSVEAFITWLRAEAKAPPDGIALILAAVAQSAAVASS